MSKNTPFRLTAALSEPLLVQETYHGVVHFSNALGWSGLGGKVVASADALDPDGGLRSRVMLQYRGGRDTWMVEKVDLSLRQVMPRDDSFGHLDKMMSVFEEKTGLELSPIDLHWMGQGVFRHTARGAAWDLKNPFELQVGKVYRNMPSSYGARADWLAERDPHGVVVLRKFGRDGDLSESFSPDVAMNPRAWQQVLVQNVPDEDEQQARTRERCAC